MMKKSKEGLKSPQEPCTKCGQEQFEGPVYVEPILNRGVHIPEHMEWTCSRCGNIIIGPVLPPAAKTE